MRFNCSDGSSDSDSDVLLAAEDEAKECCITRKHVELFDKIKKRRRIIDRLESSDEEGIDTSDITNELFTEMYRAHMKRKKTRRKRWEICLFFPGQVRQCMGDHHTFHLACLFT